MEEKIPVANEMSTSQRPAIEVLQKLGYKYEGVRRKKFLCLATNEYVDECITGLLKEEFIEYRR